MNRILLEPGEVCDGVATVSLPPQSAEMRSNSLATHRRAAPIPRLSLLVSDSVCRVPKPTSRPATISNGQDAATTTCGAVPKMTR